MAFWREDLLAVNGYDEDFKGWGGEDTEIANRLFALGHRKLAVKFRSIQFHLNHPLASRDKHCRNQALCEQSRLEVRVRCIAGVDQYTITPTKYQS